jgi:asparaginyl-tRNA synthetase
MDKPRSPTSIKDALQSSAPIAAIQVQGWVRTRRDSKDFSFIELNDGSSLRNLQVIAKNTLPNYADVQRLTTGASITVTGVLVASQGKGQKWELVADTIDIVGTADDSYPLQKKGHTPEFLREIAHLRPARIFLVAFFASAAAGLCRSRFSARFRLRPHANYPQRRLRGRERYFASLR